MNIVLFEKEELENSGSGLKVAGRRAEHLLGIVGVSRGDKLRVGVVDGMIGNAVVKSVGSDHLVVGDFELLKYPVRPWVDVLLAAPRPRMLNRVLQGMTSIGVRKIYIFRSEKVEKSFLHSPLLREDRLEQTISLGLEQGALTFRPEISIFDCPRKFFSEELSGIVENTSIRICAHPRSKTELSNMLGSIGAFTPEDHPLVAIGPEGGWTERELELFKGKDFKLVNVGERILRVEVAVPYILAQLEMLLRLSRES